MSPDLFCEDIRTRGFRGHRGLKTSSFLTPHEKSHSLRDQERPKERLVKSKGIRGRLRLLKSQENTKEAQEKVSSDDPRGLTSQELALMDFWAAYFYTRSSEPDVRDPMSWDVMLHRISTP